jgi:hypothetical protein
MAPVVVAPSKISIILRPLPSTGYSEYIQNTQTFSSKTCQRLGCHSNARPLQSLDPSTSHCQHARFTKSPRSAGVTVLPVIGTMGCPVL